MSYLDNLERKEGGEVDEHFGDGIDINNDDKEGIQSRNDGLAVSQSLLSVKELHLFKLKDFEKAIPTLDQIEAVIVAEEKELAAAEELLRQQKEEELAALLAEKKAAEEEEAATIADDKTQYEETEAGDESIEEEDEGEGEQAEQIEEVCEEEDDEFDVVIEDDIIVEDQMVFTGFEDDDKLDIESKELSGAIIVPTFDPMTILDDIIGISVEKSEFKNADAELRKKLDRKKLLEYLRHLWPQISQEQRKGNLLQRKMVHYFRRKKCDRALVEDNRTAALELMSKYYDNLLILDDIKAKKNLIEKDGELKINALIIEEEELKELAEEASKELEKVFREAAANCFSQKTGQYLPEKVIQNIITKIAVLRDQISELRLALIKSQHRMAFLNEKAKKLEDLGDGLCQAEFEQLHAETQGLGDKIEERNNELSKLRVRCNSNTHIISSIREKLNMLNKTITGQEKTIKEQRDEVASIRNYLNSMKLERDKVRRQLKSRSFDSGLLDKPILLHDYDATTERVTELEIKIQMLKANMDRYNGLLQIALAKLK